MITIDIPDKKIIDPQSSQEVFVPGGRFKFEHSLKAIAKWESKWHEPFLVNGEKTFEQTVDYILCMCDDENLTVANLTNDVLKELIEYIQDKHSATTIKEDSMPKSKIITSEVLYSYLAVAQIPFDTEDWNLDRLLLLVGAVSALHTPPKKMTQREIMEQNRKLNAQRKKELGTKG